MCLTCWFDYRDSFLFWKKTFLLSWEVFRMWQVIGRINGEVGYLSTHYRMSDKKGRHLKPTHALKIDCFHALSDKKGRHFKPTHVENRPITGLKMSFCQLFCYKCQESTVINVILPCLMVNVIGFSLTLNNITLRNCLMLCCNVITLITCCLS